MLKNFTAAGKVRTFCLLMFLFLLTGTLCAQQNRTKYYEQLTANLLQQLKIMQDENAKLADTVKEQTKKLRYLEEEYKVLAEKTNSYQQNTVAAKESSRSQQKVLEAKIEYLERKILRLERLIRDVSKIAAQPGRSNRSSARNPIRPEKAADKGEYVEHTVEKGHVLYNIARAYRVSVQEIRRINNLKGDKLSIGQKLLIPVKKER